MATILMAACGAKEDGPTVVVEEPPSPPLQVQPSTSALPQLRITTPPGTAITSKEIYVAGTMVLADSAGTVLTQGAMEIRGRGNTTWQLFPKKPYRLKLAASAALLDMPANRHWVLLANYSDKTLLRNDLSFEMSRMAGMAWTPRGRFVDLYVNGSYDGVYQLVEHVRIGADRVNMTSLRMTDTSASAITGGYLLEVDERRGEAFCFNSTLTRMVWCVNDPETLLDAGWEKQRAYITNYIARTDSAIFAANFTDPTTGYAAFIDVESAINYNIIQEVVKNVDGSLRFSGFMHKPRGGKLIFGPVWDFDLAIGNVNYDGADQTSGWRSRQALWYARLFQDPVFKSRFTSRWNELKSAGAIDSLQRLVFSRANYLNVVQVRNFERWPILGTYVWPNRVVTGSYDREVVAMNVWLKERVRWMDTEIAR
ncbi:MAG: CotH kinase family protein [Gemmatimonadota bacterium]